MLVGHRRHRCRSGRAEHVSFWSGWDIDRRDEDTIITACKSVKETEDLFVSSASAASPPLTIRLRLTGRR